MSDEMILYWVVLQKVVINLQYDFKIKRGEIKKHDLSKMSFNKCG